MRLSLALSPHPGQPHPPSCRLLVSLEDTPPDPSDLSGGPGLLLAFHLTCPPGTVTWPHAPAGRQDGLWQRTCFEVFLAPRGAPGYREFNLSPPGAWQAYDFADYRQACPLPAMAPPHMEWRTDGDGMVLEARLAAAQLPGPGPWQVGLSAVLEGPQDQLSYWALRHPGPLPDFHHPQAWSLDWPAMGRAP